MRAHAKAATSNEDSTEVPEIRYITALFAQVPDLSSLPL